MARGLAKVPLGLLYSRSGPYGFMGSEMLKGALIAVEETNTDNATFQIVPVLPPTSTVNLISNSYHSSGFAVLPQWLGSGRFGEA